MALAAGQKDPGALLTIGELSSELGVAQHILRYWETRFPQLRPMQRAGNRRYYRPADVALARRINRLLNEEGYTVRGVQKVIRDRQPEPVQPAAPSSDQPMATVASIALPDRPVPAAPRLDVARLRSIRNALAAAIGG
jgi:DNA-binding transcriptional MerR regulator